MVLTYCMNLLNYYKIKLMYNFSKYKYMDPIIYFMLFLLLILYINMHSNCLEKFTDNNTPTAIDTEPEKSAEVVAEVINNPISGWNNDDSDIYKNKYWLIKNQGFSDIYNYEDVGGDIIYNVANGFSRRNISNHLIQLNDGRYNYIVPPNNPKVTSNNPPPIELFFNNSTFKLLGIASNVYFNQYYYIFENEYFNNTLTAPFIENDLTYIKNNKLFEYTLAKIENEELTVVHYIGPRTKINIDDVIYFSQATFQLGPLLISKIN